LDDFPLGDGIGHPQEKSSAWASFIERRAPT
jgi:hypothetical protein